MTTAALGLGGLGLLFYQELESAKLLQLANETNIKVRKLDANLRSSESFLKSLVATTKFLHERGERSPAAYEKLVLSLMSARPKLITGFGVMQVPYGLVDRQWFGPYIEESQPDRGVKLPQDPRFSLVELWQAERYPQLQYYTESVKQNRYFWSEPYINDSFPIPLMTFAGPIQDAQGNTIAIVNGDINLKDLTQIKEAPELSEMGYYLLTTRQGNILSHSLNPSKSAPLQSITSIPTLKPVWDQISRELASGKSQGYLESDITDSYWVYQQVPASQWVMLQATPYNSVIRPALFAATGVTLVVGACLAFVVVMFVRQMNSRLQPILDVCDETLKSEADVFQAQDEIDRLSQAFFRMVEGQNTLKEELQITNAELIESNQLKDRFLANMSHELRTPLNAILGMTEGMQDEVFGSLNPKQIEALKMIERSGSHLLELINDILDLAKIESGEIELDYSQANVASLCQYSLSFIQQQALKQGIKIEQHIPQDLPNLHVDKRRIRQVLINLLSNAVKFTPAGGKISLAATYPQRVENRDYLRITIADTGIGIAPADIERLFQPFIQIDSDLNRQYQGTGLGLSLVKRLVELHGGQVGLTSEVGVGSCFTIDLPCIVSDRFTPQLSIPPKTTIADSLAQPSSDSLSPVILLVEDHEANTNTLVSYLSAKGYRLLVAHNGEEAIRRLKGRVNDLGEYPDLILMDIQMPGMDGIQAMEEIRRDPDLVDIPIVALTALAMAQDQERCLAAGANEYLSKPVKLKELSQTIHQLLTQVGS
jgi:signal transduction histidine kinase/ActR/RegA family two-component response regulator